LLKLQQKSVSATPKGGAIILPVAKISVSTGWHAKRLFLAWLTVMTYSEQTDDAPSFLRTANPGPGAEDPGGPPLWRQSYNNVSPDLISTRESTKVIPGRADLRISLTSICNLRCTYCHNEGQEAPWVHHTTTSAVLDNIERLLDVAARYGVKSVKFTGGDPGVYPGLFQLMDTIAGWRDRYPDIGKWGMCTNGAPFLNAKKFQALVTSRLDNLSIGIDSIEPGELSKPSSPVGVSGQALIDKFVIPLMQAWGGRAIKFDAVFTGNNLRTLNVIRAARDLGVSASVVEINGVMGTTHTVRGRFLDLIAETAEEFRLRPKLYEPLNEIYLYDEQGNTPIKFYQDHCRDSDCGNCRKIHLRVSPAAQGWGAVPCFLRAQSKMIPLVVDGELSAARFEDAIKYNGCGPQWFKDTDYDSHVDTTAPKNRPAI
jgi:molybdenum cofactor biosynthesis enzyme MoaA